jgi:spore coat protein U-like protein
MRTSSKAAIARSITATRAALAGAAAIGVLIAVPAHASSTANTTFTVTATVLPSCLISATDLAFGNYSGAEVDTNTTLSVVCNSLIAIGSTNIGIDPGTASGATVSTRKMTGNLGLSTLSYSLFRDAGRTQNWGNTIGTDTLTSLVITALGLPASLTVYGKLPANQFVAPGNYSDVVTVTLTY